jgi:hypothetical protein
MRHFGQFIRHFSHFGKPRSSLEAAPKNRATNLLRRSAELRAGEGVASSAREFAVMDRDQNALRSSSAAILVFVPLACALALVSALLPFFIK